MLLVKKCQFFHYFVWLKILRLEIRLNNVLDTKEPFFFTIKGKFQKVLKIAFLLKGLTHAFGKKMPILSLFGFGRNKTRKNA